MKKILVTGGSGFIGRHCLKLLQKSGDEIHAVSVDREKPQESVIWHTTDLLIGRNVQELVSSIKPTHLLHLSWYTTPGKYWTSEKNFLWINSSLELLRAFLQNGGKRAVIAGTCAEYDWSFDTYSESTTPLRPATIYGTCKHTLQLMVDAFSKQSGLSSAWGRIFFPFGPHEHPDKLIPSVIRALLDRKPALCTSGSQIRDYIYVEDAANAFVSLLDSKIEGAINIGTGKGFSVREIVETIGNLLDSTQLIKFGAIPERNNEPRSIVADIHRLQSIGWHPKKDLTSGLKQAIDWWKKIK
jgi:nucleoside-diphosphate-sugar epimerase